MPAKGARACGPLRYNPKVRTAGECGSEGVAPGKDRAPRQSGLERLERQALEQSPLVQDGEAPLLVVVALKDGVAVSEAAPGRERCGVIS